MCETTTIAALALVAAGTAATAYGTHQADKAQGAATDAELERQKKLRREAEGVQARTLQGNSAQNTKEGIDASAAKRGESYSQAAADVARFAPRGIDTAGSSRNPIVSDTYQDQAGRAANYVQRQAQAQAALQGFGDAMQNNAIFNANQGYDIRRLGSFMQGSANVLPNELNAAGHKGDTAKTLGGILSALGSVVGAGGATGALKLGTAAAGTGAQAYQQQTSRPAR